MMRIVSTVLLLMMTASFVEAHVVSNPVEYEHDGVTFEGFLSYDDHNPEKRPGVLIVHEWWGLNDYAKNRTTQIAQMGAVALAVDMYGKGKRGATPAEAGKLAGPLRDDRKLMRDRIQAGLEVLRKHPNVDTSRIVCIGYCFGGTVSLELARSGADIAGVVSFHGGLSTPTPEDAKHIKAKVLVLHGAADPHVDAAECAAFQKEMAEGGVDWQMNYYADAVHAFTNPKSGNDPSRGMAYNASADRRSWVAMLVFFDELFSPKQE